MKISEGIKFAGALTAFAGLTFGLPIAGYYAGEEKHEAWKAERAAREVSPGIVFELCVVTFLK